jgi:hypothetical protein
MASWQKDQSPIISKVKLISISLDRIGDNLTEINSTQSGARSIGQLATSPFSVFNDEKGVYLDKRPVALGEG